MPVLALLFLLTLLITAGCTDETPATLEIERPAGPAPWTSLDFQQSPDDFTFVVVTDNTNGARPSVFARAMDKVNLLNPAFVMSIGDYIQGYTDHNGKVIEEWDEFETFTAKLKAPFFYTAGNHDIWNDFSVVEWHRRFGPSYYHFRYKDVLFISINSEIIQSFFNPDRGVEGDVGKQRQMAWLERVLNENKDARWNFIFLHQPFWDYDEIPPEWLRVEELLGTRPYTIFAGHQHQYTRELRHGRNYITLATTGGQSRLRGIDYGEFDQVTLVNMTDKGPVIANLLLDGIHDQNMRPKELRELIEQVQMAISIEPVIDNGEMFTHGVTRFRVTNTSDRELTVKARFKDNHIIKTGRRDSSFIVGPAENRTIEVPMNALQSIFYGALQPVYATLLLSFEKPNGGTFVDQREYTIYPQTTFSCRPTENKITTDGDLSEWSALTYSSWFDTYSEENKTASPPLRFDVACDNKYLYIAGKVIDDELFFSDELSYTRQDGFIITVDARPDPHRSANVPFLTAWMNGETRRMINTGIGLVDEKPDPFFRKAVYGLPQGSLKGSTKIEGGYTVEVAIPASYLDEMQGEPWRALRLNIGVLDKDPSKGPGASLNWWRPDRFGDRAIPASGTFTRATPVMHAATP